MNIFLHEFKQNIRSVVTWSVSLAILIYVFSTLYTGFAAQAELLNQTLEKFPKEFLMAFGMYGIDMSTVLGFFTLTIVFCQICVSIQAARSAFARNGGWSSTTASPMNTTFASGINTQMAPTAGPGWCSMTISGPPQCRDMRSVNVMSGLAHRTPMASV